MKDSWFQHGGHRFLFRATTTVQGSGYADLDAEARAWNLRRADAAARVAGKHRHRLAAALHVALTYRRSALLWAGLPDGQAFRIDCPRLQGYAATST